MSEECIALTAAPQSQATSLQVLNRSSNGLDIAYQTFDTNKPNTYGNRMYVWEASGPIIPWNQEPLASVAISDDQYASTQHIPFEYQVGLGYIVGYAVGADPSDVCASLFIPADGAPTESKSLQISAPTFGTNYVKANYQCLDNYNPHSHKNWIGIWENPRAGYDGDPMAHADIQYPGTSGTGTIIGATIKIGTVYTIGYFMQPLPSGKTTLAAQVTFST